MRTFFTCQLDYVPLWIITQQGTGTDSTAHFYRNIIIINPKISNVWLLHALIENKCKTIKSQFEMYDTGFEAISKQCLFINWIEIFLLNNKILIIMIYIEC